jgi:alpha-galactosidase
VTNTLLCRRWTGPDFPDAMFAGAPESAVIDYCWDGRPAPDEYLARVWCAWNPAYLFFEFASPFTDLNVSDEWARDEPARGLWERDVVEVFLRPSLDAAYFEFEVSPLGQWLDVIVRRPREDVNFGWNSGVRVQSLIDSCRRVWSARLTIPIAPMAEALRTTLSVAGGIVWKTNLFRICGADPSRQFLAWQPTFTPMPDFHVPQAFGNLVFVE